MSRRLVVELSVLAAAAFAAFLIRMFVAAPYAIPSESMLPSLMVADTILVSKWSQGALGRVWTMSSGLRPPLPDRGDIIAFRAPPAGRQTYVKRLIGLPGDRIGLRHGIVILNDKPLPRWRIADFTVRVSPNSSCRPIAGTRVRSEPAKSGGRLCRYPRYREMLPDGRSYAVLDTGAGNGDDMPDRAIPPGYLFVLGDNRDRSADSRFPAREGGAVGLVPVSNLIGRARTVLFSTDGSGRWTAPATWRGALRGDRIGLSLAPLPALTGPSLTPTHGR